MGPVTPGLLLFFGPLFPPSEFLAIGLQLVPNVMTSHLTISRVIFGDQDMYW